VVIIRLLFQMIRLDYARNKPARNWLREAIGMRGRISG